MPRSLLALAFGALVLSAAPGRVFALPSSPRVAATPAPTGTPSREETVVFNTKSLKFHCKTCKWAAKCTKSCVTVTRTEAKRRGGQPCKDCGGDCD